MATSELKFAGLSASTLYTNLLQKGVSAHDAGLFTSAWIFENLGYTLRTFAYVEPFPEHDPAPLAPFAQLFHHKHWRDGEDVVQADPSPGDDGFNTRFDNIEKDLAALGATFAAEFAKLESMRGSIFRRLEEIRAELNRINSDLLSLHQVSRPPEPLPFPRPPFFDGLVNAGSFVGTTTFMDKKVNLFRNPSGELMMLPYINPITEQDLVGKFSKGAGELAKLFSQNADIKGRFPAAVAKKDLVGAFGDVKTESGFTVRELVDILPDNAQFASLDAMVNDVAQRNAATIRVTDGAADALSAVFGGDPATANSNIPVANLTTVSNDVKAVLVKNNVKTMGDVTKLDPQKFADMMNAEGIKETAATGASLRALANTLTQVR